MTIDLPEFRGRILEVLRLIASPADQLQYQRSAPGIDVPAELFNQWDDSYHPEDACFCSQFSERELVALARFADVIDGVANETPQRLPALDEFAKTAEWRRLLIGARDALAVLM